MITIENKIEGFGGFKPLTKYGVYFANLEAYNAGRMIGDWVYPLMYKSFEEFAEAIKEATKGADEVAIHDYDNFPNLGEYPDHESVYNLAHALEDSSLEDEVILKYFQDYYSNDFEDLEEEIEDIEDAYICTTSSLKEFAIEQADNEILNIIPKNAQQFVFNNFDYEGYERDLRHAYTIIELDNYDVAIFYND